MSRIMEFPVTPKTEQYTRGQHAVTITYFPKEKQWKWEVKYVTRRHYFGYAQSLAHAKRDADKRIEELTNRGYLRVTRSASSDC